jgi:hypothetical protein
MRRIVVLVSLFILGCVATSSTPIIVKAGDTKPHVNTPQDFLTNKDYDSVIIEVTPTFGFSPDPDAIKFLCRRVKRYCYKDQVIAIVNTANILIENAPPGTFPFFSSDTTQFESMAFRLHSTERTLVLHIAYLDLMYLHRANILAFANDSKYIVIYQCAADRQKSVLLHEFGHVIGLVSSTSTHHNPTCNPHHCTNVECIMWPTVSRDEVIEPEFDQNCLKDLERMGGKKYYR